VALFEVAGYDHRGLERVRHAGQDVRQEEVAEFYLAEGGNEDF
jgi:hypothetical protein